MLIRQILGVAVLVAVAAPASAQQVVFSRRDYAAVDTTFQQIWILDAASGTLTQASNTLRDHDQPRCMDGGARVFFSSGFPSTNWILDRTTGLELEAVDAPPFMAGPAEPITTASGAQCDNPAASPDGKRVACVAGRDLLVLDASAHTELQRLAFTGKDSTGASYAVPAGGLGAGGVPVTDVQWAPDSRQVLVGVYGEASSSTAFVSDYFIGDLAAKTWRKVMSGNDAIWLPDGRVILYTTQRDLTALPAPASARSVWTQQLVRFDVATGKSTALTSGVTNNISPDLCK